MDNTTIYIWRCAKCTNHFANISKMSGVIKQEKKCPKCKSLNELTLTSKEIYIHCLLYDPANNNYGPAIEENYTYNS